jgi:hypothetical protein
MKLSRRLTIPLFWSSRNTSAFLLRRVLLLYMSG